MRLRLTESHPEVIKAVAKGLIALPAADPARKAPVMPDLFMPPDVFFAGVVTASECNMRDWKGRQRRTLAARKRVCLLLGRHLRAVLPFAEAYHAGLDVYLVLTRLAPARLDAANLGGALKATEDAVAQTVGADDGDTNWHATFRQEPSTSVGVRIQLLTEPPERQ